MSYPLPHDECPPLVTHRNHYRPFSSVDGDLVGQRSLFSMPYEFRREPRSRTSAAVPLERRKELPVASPHDRKHSACLGHLTRNWMQRKKLVTTRTSNTTSVPTEKRNENSLQVRAVEALAVSTDRALGMGVSKWELSLGG